MNRLALALAATLVLSSANGIHAFHHWGCGGCGHSIGCGGCGLLRFGLFGHGCSSGYGYAGDGWGGCGSGRCGYASCGGSGCGTSYGGCGGGCSTANSYDSGASYGSYYAMPRNGAVVTARTVRNVQSRTTRIPANSNSRARTIVVDLREFDLDTPSKQISVAGKQAPNGLVVRNESAK